MKIKKKPGPKPKSADLKARGKSLSFPAPMADYLDDCEDPSLLIQELLAKSPKYKKHLKTLK